MEAEMGFFTHREKHCCETDTLRRRPKKNENRFSSWWPTKRRRTASSGFLSVNRTSQQLAPMLGESMSEGLGRYWILMTEPIPKHHDQSAMPTLTDRASAI